MSTANSPKTSGAHHVGLTVPDLAQAAGFFREALGFSEVGGSPDYPALFLSDGQVMVTLWQARSGEAARPFDRHNAIGLHHLALRVPDAPALDAIHRDLQARRDVRVEFAPEPLGEAGARHMICAIPGGVRLELIATA